MVYLVRMFNNRGTLYCKCGQSTLEYVIILAVVIGVIVAAASVANPQLTVIYDTVYNQ